MAHILIYHTHGATRTFSPPTSNSSNPSPQTYAAYAARFTHIYPSQSKVHSGILPPTSRHPVTPIRAQLSSILLAQRSALTRFEALKIPPHYAGTHFLPIHADPAFRAEINDGVGFYLDIYSSSSEVISLLHKWPFDDATKRLFRSERLPYVDLIVQFDQLNEKLHKLGQASLGYYVKYHCIPERENRAVEMDVMQDLDRYGAKLESIMKEKNLKEKEKEIKEIEVVRDDYETEEELEEFQITNPTPMPKPGGKSILATQSTQPKKNTKRKEKEISRDNDEAEEELQALPPATKTTPASKSGGKSFLTPVSKSEGGKSVLTPMSKSGGGKSILTPQSTSTSTSTQPKKPPKPKANPISQDNDETEEEIEELPISKTTSTLKTTPVSKSQSQLKSGGKSIPTPQSTPIQAQNPKSKSKSTPQSTPIQKPKPKPKLKLTPRDSHLHQHTTSKNI